jgi:NAD(P)-dependent dehydrogenase (short-subunit alcohol dehydrogenase family)
MDLSPLSNRVVLVAGATRGIGREAALACGRAGARVVAVGRSTDDSPNPVMSGTLEEVVRDVEATGAEVLGTPANLASPDGVAAVAARVDERFGRCDALIVNFAYDTDFGDPLTTPVSKWNTAIKVNMVGPLLLLQAFVPGMISRGDGRVISVSTGAAAHYVAGQLPYSVTKAGLEQITFGFGHAHPDQGVSFNVLRADGVPTETLLAVGGSIGVLRPGARYNTPAEVGTAIAWLAARPADFTGATLDFEQLRALGALPEPTFALD